MTNKHTGEPWHVNNQNSYTMRVDNEQGECACLPTGKDNARRIVACVNACAGIPTEKIEEIAKSETNRSRAGLFYNVAHKLYRLPFKVARDD